jgi:hypothetical protein
MSKTPISFEDGVELLLSNNFALAEKRFKQVSADD